MSDTKPFARRFRLFQEIGCVACILEGEKRGEDRSKTPADVHHLLSGGRRIGHASTIPLCPWHHRGQLDHHQYNKLRADEKLDGEAWPAVATREIGPSLAVNKPAFHRRYGTDAQLFERTEEELEKLHGLTVGSGQ